MAPEIFLKAYARATTEEFRLSEEAPHIDAKNPAGKINIQPQIYTINILDLGNLVAVARHLCKSSLHIVAYDVKKGYRTLKHL